MTKSNNLSLSSQLQSVSSSPRSMSRTTIGLDKSVTFSKTSGFLASRGKTSQFSVFVSGLGNPVQITISSDVLQVGVDHDDFKVFVGGILSDPVRVHDSEGTELFTNSFFGDRLNSSLEFQLVDTLVDGFTVGGTFGSQSLSAASSDSDSEDGETQEIILEK